MKGCEQEAARITVDMGRERASEHQRGTLGSGCPGPASRVLGTALQTGGRCGTEGSSAEDRRSKGRAEGEQGFLSPEVLGIEEGQSLGREW